MYSVLAFYQGLKATLAIGGLIAFGVGIISASPNNGLNLGAGILTGLYPFLGWVWLGSLLKPGQHISAIKRALVFVISILKTSLIGVILYFVVSPAWFNLFLFVLGTLIAQVIMISLIMVKEQKNVR